MPDEPPEWQRAALSGDVFLYLTPAELAELGARQSPCCDRMARPRPAPGGGVPAVLVRPDDLDVRRPDLLVQLLGAPAVRWSLLSVSAINSCNFCFFALFVLYTTRSLHVRPGPLD